jgi:GAF domain-containing protein/ActR/RegA family two-component response regulator
VEKLPFQNDPTNSPPSASPPRVLYVGDCAEPVAGAEAVHLPDTAGLCDCLRSQHFDSVVIDPQRLSQLVDENRRDAMILKFADRGLALLDKEGRIVWSNSIMQDWCGKDPLGQGLSESLGSSAIAANKRDPFGEARAGSASGYRSHQESESAPSYLDVNLQPVKSASGEVIEMMALCRDVSAEVEQQKKLDALHKAGRELAALDVSQLAEMSEPERIALLKYNLRHYIHDLLHYDTIEVRLLDRATGELKPLLEDGMTSEAATRVLYAKPMGNGVTGYVAHTGRSYLCPDTATDPHYILGATGARSSMTVPLTYDDEVVGTLNVESPHPNFFGQDDLQFTELFSREIATALHTLDLLTAQQSCAASQALDSVGREIALPVDDLLASAATLLGQIENSDDAMADHLRRIMVNARLMKNSVKQVGERVSPLDPGLAAQQILAGKRVLVIDQNEVVRKQAHLMLERLGATAETAGTAAEGLAMLSATPYDAVFTEVRPIDLGGYDTYCKLRQARPGIRIAMTNGFSYDACHSLVKARQDGLKFVLFKPFKQEQVVNAVLNIVPANVPVPMSAGTF